MAKGSFTHAAHGEQHLRAIGALGSPVTPPLIGNEIAEHWTPRLGAMPSKRELDVLRLLAEGYLDREIALALGVGPSVVALHRDHLCTKAGARNRVELTRYAIAHGYVQTAWEHQPITGRNTSIVNDDHVQ